MASIDPTGTRPRIGPKFDWHLSLNALAIIVTLIGTSGGVIWVGGVWVGAIGTKIDALGRTTDQMRGDLTKRIDEIQAAQRENTTNTNLTLNHMSEQLESTTSRLDKRIDGLMLDRSGR